MNANNSKKQNGYRVTWTHFKRHNKRTSTIRANCEEEVKAIYKNQYPELRIINLQAITR